MVETWNTIVDTAILILLIVWFTMDRTQKYLGGNK